MSKLVQTVWRTKQNLFFVANKRHLYPCRLQHRSLAEGKASPSGGRLEGAPLNLALSKTKFSEIAYQIHWICSPISLNLVDKSSTFVLRNGKSRFVKWLYLHIDCCQIVPFPSVVSQTRHRFPAFFLAREYFVKGIIKNPLIAKAVRGFLLLYVLGMLIVQV